ncbi:MULTISPECIES: GNAT family N-acetyltransferase [Providencia]|uniref:Putative GNAT-family acetyltransferase n=2 Tax=Providencia heimbachae TaxID=333962 RepID=A0A1B7K3B3_9GAMM|nr:MULTISPECIES: GNAT family N-acetyltransferase [Providencia]MBP6121313.1 GNAT family N-acetyltransferase [Providencia sp.]MDD9340483.1 GNAT family N-acetyltransferase [Providencia heimbachae]NIH22798.1 GNAT family N-acetyltransferase [Providencia heimbachae]OAT54637.1 putative GNAT-family acetyltransferase [Providencia heimbachae ATCC 35613]QCJ70195.1 N-acetyltransferase [Providencia heimbachae]
MNVEIKQATIKDASLILDMIIELADYEKARHEVKASVADIEDSLFSQDSKTEALICYIDGKAAGYAVFFTSYSTWLGNNGIYLEDLYVSPDFRGAGAGKKLLKHIAVLAAERKCQRLEWSVLDWNQPAIDFYNSIGAEPQDEWIRYRMDAKTIAEFVR